MIAVVISVPSLLFLIQEYYLFLLIVYNQNFFYGFYNTFVYAFIFMLYITRRKKIKHINSMFMFIDFFCLYFYVLCGYYVYVLLLSVCSAVYEILLFWLSFQLFISFMFCIQHIIVPVLLAYYGLYPHFLETHADKITSFTSSKVLINNNVLITKKLVDIS